MLLLVKSIAIDGQKQCFCMGKTSAFWRVLDVVEVLGVLDFPALRALKGRQSTGGGKQRAAPGRGKLITPPPLRHRRREGAGGGRRLTGGYASLTPVCTLSPFQG